MKLAALFVVLLGCGDNLPDGGQPHSGARLKLGWWSYADGTRQRETGWLYDAALGERCTPAAWSDGQRYCAPASDEAVYVSDSCTRALGRTVVDVGPAPFFTTTFYLLGQPLPSRVFARGESTLAPISVWQKHGNDCIGPLEPGDNFEYFELGPEVVNLARVYRGDPRGDGRLAAVDDRSEDGLRVPVAIYDRDAAAECTPVEHANATSIECAADDAALVSYFHEVGCIEPELAAPSGTMPASARRYSPLTRCWSYYDVGAEVTAPPLYEQIGGSCVSVAPPGGAHFFVMAAPRELPMLTREHEATTTRMVHIDRVHDTLRLDDPLLFDRELATECRREGDRCVPATEARVLPFFQDAQCQTQIELALVPSGDCDPPSAYARKGDDFYPLLAEYTRSIYELSTGDTCGIYVPPAPYVAWVIGPVLDPSELATAKLMIDP